MADDPQAARSWIGTVVLSTAVPTDRRRLIDEATLLFFETANTQSFSSAEAKDGYLARWFGRYVDLQPEACLLALDDSGRVTGYVAGCFDTFGLGAQPIIRDISYYTPALCAALSSYPAHFHINVKPERQGSGIGRELVWRFIDLCRAAGANGIHVVTGAASPAVRFYERCGFRLETAAPAASGLAVLTRATHRP